MRAQPLRRGWRVGWIEAPQACSLPIAQGPVAALEFIKNLGTNGGGFFNVNGTHPYENPTPFVGFLA
jgi:K+-transporting ATPase A subunit